MAFAVILKKIIVHSCSFLLKHGRTYPFQDNQAASSQSQSLRNEGVFSDGHGKVCWHQRCSTAEHQITRRSIRMKLLLATMFKKIPVRTTKQRATLCKRCGVRIYSLAYLKAHLEAHDRKNH
jgi:hypothetical protein